MLSGHAKTELGRNDSLPLVQEYFTRKALAEIGYVTSTNELPAWKADCFAAIAMAVAEFQAEQIEKMNKRR